MVPAATFDEHLAALRRRIEEALAASLARQTDVPPRLREAMRYSLMAGGKRLRPLLVLLAAEACGCGGDAGLPAACAIEMIHTYSLIHDDLPAMDDDDLRRGRPTNHKVYGEAVAILAGDGLLTLAFETLARDVRPPAVAAACCGTLAQAAGVAGMVGGQADDMAEDAAGRDLEALESIHRRKTGALLTAALVLGAEIAQAGAEPRRALAEYGRRLGLAFQIVDDVLDVRGAEADLGKRVGKDSAHGKLTFPALLGVDESLRRAGRLIDEACAALSVFGPAGRPLEELARFVLQRNR